jgi:hypothetical protein
MVTTTWIVPEPAAPHTLFTVIDPDDLISEFDEANNQLSLNIGGTDLAVTLLSKSVDNDGSARVVVQVINQGAPSAPASTLAIRYADNPTGSPLATVAAPALDPGNLAQLAIELPAGAVTQERLFTATADDDAQAEDIDRTNNSVTFAMGASDAPCLTDVDMSGRPIDVATDVVYIARHLLGLAPVPASFRALDAGIPSDSTVEGRADAINAMLDVDANGVVDVATDIVYIARHLLGLAPVPASFRALDPSIPPDSAIGANIEALCP